MSKEDILGTIKMLHLSQHLPRSERRLLFKLKKIILNNQAESNLSDDVSQQIKKIFERRWYLVLDKSDYTKSKDEVNCYWLSIAKSISDTYKESFFELLIPNQSIVKDAEKYLIDYKDLTHFFVLDDGAIYPTQKLVKDWDSKGVLCIQFLDVDDQEVERHISLKELRRIIYKDSNRSFTEFLWKKVMPTWRINGTLCRKVAPSLIKVINCYFENDKENSNDNFRGAVNEVVSLLKYNDPQDAYFLYGSVLDVQNPKTKKSFLVAELLIACIEGELDTLEIDNAMKALAFFITNFDLSYISCSIEMSDIYAAAELGPYVSIQTLQQCNSKLISIEDSGFKTELMDINRRLESNLISLEKAVESLSLIFKLRWDRIKGTGDDYTSKQNGVNFWWIRTAQLLCGAGLIPDNYYTFLMPTLKQFENSYTNEPLEYYPLDYYVLSKDNTLLINLASSVAYYKEYGLFWNCSGDAAIPLTPEEESRISLANMKFHRYLQYLHKSQPALKKSTVMLLKKLVEETLVDRNLDPFMKPSDSQVLFSSIGFAVFYEQFCKLPADEKTKLLVQEISLSKCNSSIDNPFARKYSVANLFEKIRRGSDDGCIATCSKYFMKLVVDYANWLQFPAQLEESVIVGSHLMRKNSKHKIYSDYDWLSKEEAERRISLLMISILTHDFNYTLSGNKVSLWQMHNRFDDFVLQVFELLKTHIESSENSSDPRYVYVSLIEGIILPVWTQKYKNQNTDESDVYLRPWLYTIVNGSMFDSRNRPYSCEQLFFSINAFRKKPTLQTTAHIFLDEILYIWNHPTQSDLLKMIKVNVGLTHFLQKRDADDFKMIINSLHKTPAKPDKNILFNDIYDFLVCNEQRSRKETSVFSLFSLFWPEPNVPQTDLPEKPDLSQFTTVNQLVSFVRNDKQRPQQPIAVSAGA